jgi:hypothetical protein
LNIINLGSQEESCDAMVRYARVAQFVGYGFTAGPSPWGGTLQGLEAQHRGGYAVYEMAGKVAATVRMPRVAHTEESEIPAA